MEVRKYSKEVVFYRREDVSEVISWLGDRPYSKLDEFVLLLDSSVCRLLEESFATMFSEGRIKLRPHLLGSYTEKFMLGLRDGQKIFLSSPSWDCGWYWGFGYLGNKDCHYFVECLERVENYVWYKDESDGKHKCAMDVSFVNLYDGFKGHFDEGTFVVSNDHDVWLLAELFSTFYKVKETCSMLRYGGAHYTNNPLKSFIVDKEYFDWLNYGLLPMLFEEIYRVLNKYSVK